MKKCIIFLLGVFLLTSCTQLTQYSAKEAYQKGTANIPGLVQAFQIADTEAEFIYVASMTNGFVVLLKIEKQPPHRLTQYTPLFYCNCNLKNKEIAYESKN